MMKKNICILLVIFMFISIAPLYSLAGSSLSKHNVGDIITFGSYPQSRLIDKKTIESLEKQSLKWESYGYCYGNGTNITARSDDYMKYADVVYNGVKYRAVRTTEPRPYQPQLQPLYGYSYQDDNGYVANKTYWFKFEDLEWIVLDPNTGLVLAKDIIDSQPAIITSTEYNESKFFPLISRKEKEKSVKYDNNYESCNIREWLTGYFYNNAFSAEEQEAIAYTVLDNGINYKFSDIADLDKHSSATTTDKVFLLSYDDAYNHEYGFPNNPYENQGISIPAISQIMRQAQGSDYAKCQGLMVANAGNKHDGFSNWYLRTPGINNMRTCVVEIYGDVNNTTNGNDTSTGVRPAIRISDDKLAPNHIKCAKFKNQIFYCNYKKKYKLDVEIEKSGSPEYTIKYASSDPNIVSVDQYGNIETLKTGNARVYMTLTDSSGTEYKDVCEVQVEYSFGQILIIIFLLGFWWY